MVYLVANREPTLAGFSYKLLSDIASIGCALILPIQAASQELGDLGSRLAENIEYSPYLMTVFQIRSLLAIHIYTPLTRRMPVWSGQF